MFWRVHNYDLKKKMYSRLAVGWNDNYDPKKKVQSSGRFIITSGKKGSVVWPSVGMVGGVPRARMFQRVHNYDLKKKGLVVCGGR